MKGGGNVQHPEYLYHYTTLDFVPKILEDGFLMLAPSNLVKPKRYWKERRDDGNYDIVSDTDDIKPVVWLTQEELGASDDRDTIAIGMAAGGVRAVNKMTAKFVIPWNDKYQWWLDWQILLGLSFRYGIDFGIIRRSEPSAPNRRLTDAEATDLVS